MIAFAVCGLAAPATLGPLIALPALAQETNATYRAEIARRVTGTWRGEVRVANKWKGDVECTFRQDGTYVLSTTFESRRDKQEGTWTVPDDLFIQLAFKQPSGEMSKYHLVVQFEKEDLILQDIVQDYRLKRVGKAIAAAPAANPRVKEKDTVALKGPAPEAEGHVVDIARSLSPEVPTDVAGAEKILLAHASAALEKVIVDLRSTTFTAKIGPADSARIWVLSKVALQAGTNQPAPEVVKHLLELTPKYSLGAANAFSWLSWWSDGATTPVLENAVESAKSSAERNAYSSALLKCAEVHTGSYLAELQLKMPTAENHRAVLVKMGARALPALRTERNQLASQYNDLFAALANDAHNKRIQAKRSANDIGANATAKAVEELNGPLMKQMEQDIRVLDDVIRDIEKR